MWSFSTLCAYSSPIRGQLLKHLIYLPRRRSVCSLVCFVVSERLRRTYALSICLHSNAATKPIAVVDLNKPDRISVIDAIYYTDFHSGHAYVSNYKSVLTAQFDRRADTGEIKLSDIPKRIEGEELLTILEGLLTRGKDKKPRQMHPHSLANLRPAPRFSRANRPCKKRKLSDEQIDEAIKLREAGFAWRMLGDRYGVSHDTLMLAVRTRGAKCHIGR